MYVSTLTKPHYTIENRMIYDKVMSPKIEDTTIIHSFTTDEEKCATVRLKSINIIFLWYSTNRFRLMTI